MLLIYLTMRVTDVLMFFFLFFILFRQEQSRSQTSPCRRLLTTSRSSSPSPVRSNTWKCEGRYALSIMPNYSWINMLYWFLFKLLIWRESETSQVAYVTFKEFHGADTALLLSVSYLNASILASSIYSSWPSILPEIFVKCFQMCNLEMLWWSLFYYYYYYSGSKHIWSFSEHYTSGRLCATSRSLLLQTGETLRELMFFYCN